MTEPLPDGPMAPSDTSVRPGDGPQPGQDPNYVEVEVDPASADEDVPA